ncbi:helix-turn-helix domain-containing protein [Streptomyces sp. NRRL S-337]|uniref:helix-turn-helix domain-containing protein n=1 Tax=Streptomyces sp. NRRL S-337 TaxID=1463900 RepID=UPI003B637559
MARHLNRSPSTISRELTRSAATRSNQLAHRALFLSGNRASTRPRLVQLPFRNPTCRWRHSGVRSMGDRGFLHTPRGRICGPRGYLRERLLIRGGHEPVRTASRRASAPRSSTGHRSELGARRCRRGNRRGSARGKDPPPAPTAPR